MKYSQITSEERYMLAALRTQEASQAEMARVLGRHRSSISREFKRNCCHYDGFYRPSKAQERTNGRRVRSRRNRRISGGAWRLVERYLHLDWSPEQIAGWFPRRLGIRISHETIYLHIWRDKQNGGSLWTHLRGSQKKRRKRYGTNENRGRLAGKRHISERSDAANDRTEKGHWEIDTVVGPVPGSKDCILSLVDRRTGLTLIGKLPDRTSQALATRALELIRESRLCFQTITADNGSEFREYKAIESQSGVEFFFAPPLADARVKGHETMKVQADTFAETIYPIIAAYVREKMSLRGIAAELNRRAIKTARGGEWQATQVANIISRMTPTHLSA